MSIRKETRREEKRREEKGREEKRREEKKRKEKKRKEKKRKGKERKRKEKKRREKIRKTGKMKNRRGGGGGARDDGKKESQLDPRYLFFSSPHQTPTCDQGSAKTSHSLPLICNTRQRSFDPAALAFACSASCKHDIRGSIGGQRLSAWTRYQTHCVCEGFVT